MGRIWDIPVFGNIKLYRTDLKPKKRFGTEKGRAFLSKNRHRLSILYHVL